MDVAALAAGIPWDFATFPEYLASVGRHGLKRLAADQPEGIRHVLVNGTPIRTDGKQDLTTRTGQLVRPGPHTRDGL